MTGAFALDQQLLVNCFAPSQQTLVGVLSSRDSALFCYKKVPYKPKLLCTLSRPRECISIPRE